MQSLDLQQLITTCINQSWPEFEREHPRLAAILDRSLLLEEAQRQLEHDPAYQQAIAQAQHCAATGEELLQFVQPIVKQLFARLIG